MHLFLLCIKFCHCVKHSIQLHSFVKCDLIEAAAIKIYSYVSHVWPQNNQLITKKNKQTNEQNEAKTHIPNTKKAIEMPALSMNVGDALEILIAFMRNSLHRRHTHAHTIAQILALHAFRFSVWCVR